MQHYKSQGAFHAALNARLKQCAIATGRPVDLVRRQFFTQRFLARVFSSADSGWVLAGGTGLLVRIPGGRTSNDVDLLHTGTIAEAVESLRSVCGTSELDPLDFELAAPEPWTGRTQGVMLAVTAYIGSTRLANFPIDIAVGRTTIGRVEHTQIDPIVSIDDLVPLPPFALYPIEDQIADKIGAMYQKYGTPSVKVSTRYRDLVDLILIVGTCTFHSSRARAAITAELQRRNIGPLVELRDPGRGWRGGYRSAAATVRDLPTEATTLDGALAAVNDCIAPLLQGAATGTWQPTTRTWSAR